MTDAQRHKKPSVAADFVDYDADVSRRLALTGFFAAVAMASACGGPALPGGPTPPLPVRSDPIYALFFGPQTTLSVTGTSLCGPGHPSGFHDEWHFGGTRLPVAIIPACAMSDSDPHLTGADVITPSLSHELLEA